MRYSNSCEDEKRLQLLIEEDIEVFNYYFQELNTKLSSYFKQRRLSREDVEELLLDTISIFIQKVKNKEYTYTGIPIMVYLTKVAKYRATYYYRRNARERKLSYDIHERTESSQSEYSPQWELVEMGMIRLKERERKLIELTFFEGYKDKELLELNLVDYSSIDSIKSQRYKCIQKLIKIIRELSA